MGIETLGKAYDAGWRICCAHGKMRGMKSGAECRERANLDLETLVWTRAKSSRWTALKAVSNVRTVGHARLPCGLTATRM